MKTIAPYGSWHSPVTVEYVAGKDRNLGSYLGVDGDRIYFLESRPDESGRSVLMCRQADGRMEEVLPAHFNVRSRYLEYGARACLVHQGVVYFVHDQDQQVYCFDGKTSPVALTREKDNRFADFILDKKRGKLFCLREVLAHPQSRNTICSIDLKTGRVEDIVTGADFYHCPRLNQDGSKLLWISWNHPNMAWNGTQLWSAELAQSGRPEHAQKIAGDSLHGVCQAQWGAADKIYFIAELEEWFQLYQAQRGQIHNLFPVKAEFALPDWTPGTQQYALNGDKVCATFLQQGRWQILQISPTKAELLGQPWPCVASIVAYQDGFAFIAGTSDHPMRLMFLNAQGEFSELHCLQKMPLSAEDISIAQEIQFPTEDAGVGYAWLYLPQNKNFSAPEAELPPLLVKCHGGPTSMSDCQYSKVIQFWTSRGYAVADINYGGSSGFGRRYRERLRLNWGKVDIADCVSAVKFLGKQGLIDPQRVAIRGGSAGGYTVLAALTFTQEIFAVGASYYGVSDLEVLAKETHKLESRYMDQLIGPYPEAIALYHQRSPIHHIDQLNCPIIFFQGDQDRVVPPNQSAMMFECLKKKGITTEYHLYAGEGHGFRQAQNIQHSLLRELSFFAQAFGHPLHAQDQR